MREPTNNSLEDLELSLLLEGVFHRYGYDFRNYSRASLTRRVQARVQAEELSSISELQARVLHDSAAFERFFVGLTVHVTAMFRDPGYYAAFRQKVVPWLRTLPFLRVWVAGCATGEELYSLAILLREEGLIERSRIYATDLSEAVLTRAKAGVFPLALMQEYTANYQQAGGQGDFSAYYTANNDSAVLASALKQNVLFAPHNLVSDGSFNEFHFISCRNVMIYFNHALQERVQRLLFESLAPQGFIAVGRNETMRFTPHETAYDELDAKERIYRKKS